MDVLKEYLVSLGFDLDTSAYNKTLNAMSKVESVISGFANHSVTNFALAGTAVASFVALANLGLAKFVAGLAQADLDNAKFARLMWTTKENATAYNYSLKALGATIQDLYLSPELMQRYQALRAQAMQMGPPSAEYEAEMKKVRDISFEFSRLKLEATYALQWIGYYLMKYMDGPATNFLNTLRGINDKIVESMPEWTKKVAQVAAIFMHLGSTVFQLGGDIKKIWDELNSSTKTIMGITAGFFTLLKMGPIGWIIAGLTALLLLIDDYYTWKRGGKSALGDMWDELKNAQNGDLIKSFTQDINDLSTNILDLSNNLKTMLDNLAKLAGFKDFGDFFSQTFIGTLQVISDTLKAISGSLQVINGIFEGDNAKAQGGVNSVQGAIGNVEGHMKKNMEKNKNQPLNKAWDSFANWLNGWLHFSGGGPNLGDKLQKNLQDALGSLSNQINNPQTAKQSYTSKVPVSTISVVHSPVFQVYGNTDPQATAVAIKNKQQDIQQDMFLRLSQGVIR